MIENLTSFDLDMLDPSRLESKMLIRSTSFDGSPIECLINYRKDAEYTLIFLPSAQPKREELRAPIFHRWSWGDLLTEATTITISDPSLHRSKIHGCWFLSGDLEVDYIDEMASFLSNLVRRVGISSRRTIFYGSSMGGFGALMLASKFDSAAAIAEVPQLNLVKYPHRSTLRSISSAILKGTSVNDFFIKSPHKLSVLDRFLKERRVPEFELITNSADEEFQNHLRFLEEVASLRGHVRSIGEVRLTILPGASGHAPLSKTMGISLIRSTSAWQSQTQSFKTPEDLRKDCAASVVEEIRSRIPRFEKKYDYRGYVYLPDGEFAHTSQYSINGANPDSENPVTEVNAGLKWWSLWCRSGKLDSSQLAVAVRVGKSLLNKFNADNVIPLPPYKSGYYSYSAGWYSGIQLKNVALWARLWSIESDFEEKRTYREAIDRMLDRYLKPVADGGVLASLSDISPDLATYWLPQEYPLPSGGPQRHVLNGAQFAVIALYDAADILGDKSLLDRAKAFNEALLVAAELATIGKQPTEATSYGLEYYTGLDSNPHLYRATYHLTHCVLAGVLYGITRHPKWLELANRWINCCAGENACLEGAAHQNFEVASMEAIAEKREDVVTVRLAFSVADDAVPAVEYAFYLLQNGQKIDQRWYSKRSQAEFQTSLNQGLSVVCFVRHQQSMQIR